jgi:hypothetical protein
MNDTDQTSSIAAPLTSPPEADTSGRVGWREAAFALAICAATVAVSGAWSANSALERSQDRIAAGSDREQFNRWVETLGPWHGTD